MQYFTVFDFTFKIVSCLRFILFTRFGGDMRGLGIGDLLFSILWLFRLCGLFRLYGLCLC
jgi:hypothetical protein